MPKATIALNHVILTEDDLQLLDNALLHIAQDCRQNGLSPEASDAERIRFRDSASDYDALRFRLESADTLEFER